MLLRFFHHLSTETEMNLRAITVLIAAGWVTGCTLGPNYRRPAVQVPQTFRAPDPLPAPQAESLADLKWWEVFKDEKLQDLIRAAVAANYDLRDAVAPLHGGPAHPRGPRPASPP